MLVTGMTPNLDAFLFVETEDENRIKTKHPIILFVSLTAPDGSKTGISPVYLDKNGMLVIGGRRIIRDEPGHDNHHD